MNLYELDTPVAVVDLDIMEKNITSMAGFTSGIGVKLRPHIKTHKVPEITVKQLDAGADGITCAKLGEAEIMAELAGAGDIFIANQIVGDDKIRRMLDLAEKLKMSTAVDSIEVAQPISDSAVKRSMRLDVLIKTDVGLKRTGVLPGEPALELAKKLEKMPGLHISGIYTHEGHVYGATSLENLYDLAWRSGQDMVQTADLLRKSGINVDIVSVGATPSARMTCKVAGVNESRPGTYVFNDFYQIKLGSAKEDDCALTVLATVISVPSHDRAIIDAGTKSFTSEKSSAFGVYGLIKGIPEARLVRAYEEHGVIEFDPSTVKFKVGDKLEVIPNHVCPAVNLFDELVGVRKGEVEVVWNVSARGKLR